MTVSHLQRLQQELERNHWKVLERDDEFQWKIARPNGDTPLVLEFTPGHSDQHLGLRLEDIESSIACGVAGHDEIAHLYFGKYSGKFQKDVVNFVAAIDDVDAGE